MEACHGRLDDKQQIVTARAVRLKLDGSPGDGRHRFTGEIPCDHSGTNGFTVRVRPCHPDANNLLATGLMRWW